MMRLVPKIGLLTLFLASLVPISAQDSDNSGTQDTDASQQTGTQADASSQVQDGQATEQTDTPATNAAGAEAQSLSRAQSSSNGRRTLYFIGPEIRANRQTGPIVGAPKTILPQPFVTPGSVPIPDPTPLETVEGEQGQAGDEAPAGLQQNTDTLEPAVLADPLRDQGEQEGSAIDAVGSEVQPNLDNQDGQDIQAAELEQLDPSGIPVATDRPGLDTIWEGYTRVQIARLLERASEPTQSMAVRNLARDIAASRFILPDPQSDADIHTIIKARLNVFSAQADSRSFAALVDALPQDRDWSAIAREIVTAHLLDGRLVDACTAGELERAIDTDPFWVKLSAFCLAANGNRSGVDFELSILEEGVNLDPAFYQLIDRILVEGEQPAGSIIADPAPLNATLNADVLSAVMARLARVQIDAVDLAEAEMLSLPLLLANPGLSDEVRMQIVRFGLANGYALKADWVQFAGALNLTDDMQALLHAGPGEAAAADNSDAALLSDERSDIEGVEDPNAKAIAIMAGLMQGDARIREAALAKVTSEGALGALSQVAPFITEIAEQWPRGQTSAAAQAALARLALLAGDNAAYAHWTLGLRSAVAGESEDVDAALKSLVPYLLFDGYGASPAALYAWFDSTPAVTAPALGLVEGTAEETIEAEAQPFAELTLPKMNSQRVALLLAIKDSLDGPLENALWEQLSSAPYAGEGHVIAPHFWRMTQDAAQRQDPLDMLYHLMGLMQAITPADMPAAGSAALLKAIQDIGFTGVARQLASEIMVEQGL